MTILRTSVSQQTDVQGSENRASSLDIAEEFFGLGVPVGPTGGTASIVAINDTQLTISGLTGMTANSPGHTLTLSNCAISNNDGDFSIVTYISSSTVIIINGAGVSPDANNGNIIWVERYPYSLEADLNYIRTDRTYIKGVEYYQTVAPYQRPSAIGMNVPTNLSNIAGNTTDAISIHGSVEVYGISVNIGEDKIIYTNAGQLKHANTVDTTGIPCFDAMPFTGSFKSCFVRILDGYQTGGEMQVISGIHAGERIIGISNGGSSVSPDSIEIVFYSCPNSLNPQFNSTPYIWEADQPTTLNIIYSYGNLFTDFTPDILTLPIILPTSSGGTGNGITTLIGDISAGPGTGVQIATIESISGPSPVNIIPNQLQWNSNTINPLINQANLPDTSTADGINGSNLSITAQLGQSAIGVANNGGNGGDVILTAGLAGNSALGSSGIGGTINLNSGLRVKVLKTNSTNYVMDTNSSSDYIVLLSSSLARIIYLPNVMDGRIVKIKDQSANAGTNIITIMRSGSSTIDGSISYIINLNNACVELTSDGINWYITSVYNGVIM